MTQDDVQRAPYPGLRAFRREETDLFFGREDCIVSMVDRLAATRFLAVLGSSGTGKSSLVRTGLLDGLELGLMGKAGSRWRIVDFRPGGMPLKNLARRLLETEDPDGKAMPPEQDVDLLRALLARGPRSIIEWCRAGHVPKGTNLLLLVDQFEELFRYQSYAGREEAEAFVALLVESAHSKEFPVYVTITMRSEYLGACSLIEGLSEAINAGMFLTPRMTRDQCREAIIGPAQVVGIDIDAALVNRLLNDLANFAPWEESDAHDQLDRIMRRADQLPLLQYTLNRMWLRARERSKGERITLTLGDYDAIGGLSGALDSHANQIFDELGQERWPVVEWVFRALTAGSTISDAVRQPTQFGDLVTICGGDEPSVRAVVDAFRAPGVNFLVPELDSRQPKLADDAFVDISHESLIRQWRKLSAWLDLEAHAAQQWRRLVDRYATGELLHGRELANVIAWRAETHPNAAWAKRYGGNYDSVIAFLDRSQLAEKSKRNTSFLLRTAAAVAVFCTAGLVIYLVQTNNNKNALNVALTVQRDKEKRESDERVAAAQKQIEDEKKRNFLAVSTFASKVIFGIAQKSKDTDINIALAIANETLDLVREQVKSYPTDNETQRLLSVTLNIYGDVKLRANDPDPAAKAFDESLAITRKLTQIEPNNSLWQDDLALALVRVARVKVNRASVAVPSDSAEAKAEFEEARKLYEEATGIDRKLVAAEPKGEHALTNFQAHLQSYGDLLVRMNDLKAARDVYVELVEIRRRLLALNTSNVSWMRDLATALQKVAETLAKLGDMAGANKALNEEIALDTEVAKRQPNDVTSQQNFAISLISAGDTKARANELADARKLYEQALELRRKVLAADPENTSKMKSLSDVLDKVGNMARRLDDREAARKAFDEELAIDRKVSLRDIENTQWQKDLVWSLNRVGDLQRDMSNFPSALKAFEESVEVANKLLSRDSESVDRMQSVASIWDRIGGVKDKLNDLPGAQEAFEKQLDLRRQIASHDSENNSWQKDISSALDKLGEIMRRSNSLQPARRMFDEELAIDRRLALKDPDNLAWQADLVWSLNKVGDFQRQTGNFLDARKNYQEAVSIDRKLLEREPNSAQRYRKVSTDLNKLSNVLVDLNEFADARKAHDEIFQNDLQLLKLARQQYASGETATTRNELVEVLGTLSWEALLSSRSQSALDNASEALKLDTSKTWIKVNLGHAYLFLGRYEEAKAVYLMIKDVPTATAGRTFSYYIKDDYQIFRRMQIATPELTRMEQELGI